MRWTTPIISTLLWWAGPGLAAEGTPWADLAPGSARLAELSVTQPPPLLIEAHAQDVLVPSVWRRDELVLAGTSDRGSLSLQLSRGPRHAAPELPLNPALDALSRELGAPCGELVASLGRPASVTGGRYIWTPVARQRPWTMSAIEVACERDKVSEIRAIWRRNDDIGALAEASRRLPPPSAKAFRWPLGVVVGMGLEPLLERWGPPASSTCRRVTPRGCNVSWPPAVYLDVDAETGAVLELDIYVDTQSPPPPPFIVDEADRRILAGEIPTAWGPGDAVFGGLLRLYRPSAGHEVYVFRRVPWARTASAIRFRKVAPDVVGTSRGRDLPDDGGKAEPSPRVRPFFAKAPAEEVVIHLGDRANSRPKGLRGLAIDLLGSSPTKWVEAFGRPGHVELTVDSLTLKWREEGGGTLSVDFDGESVRARALQYSPETSSTEPEYEE